MVVAGLGQFYAGLLASSLAALDDYLVPALGFIARQRHRPRPDLPARIDEDGTDAVAWGMALNAVARDDRSPRAGSGSGRGASAMPVGAAPGDLRGARRRLLELGAGAALPLALQAIYLVCLPIAAREGRRLRDELRVRVPHRGRGRRHQRLVARARHRRSRSTRLGLDPRPDRAPRRGLVLARAPRRRADGRDLRRRGRAGRRPRPRRSRTATTSAPQIGRLVVALAP